MVYTFEACIEQVEKLQAKYPKIIIVEANEKRIRLEGTILVFRAIDDFTLRKEYPLEIVIPIGSEKLPYIVDSSRVINSSYCHLNSGRRLCLETDIVVRNRFIQGFDLVQWMDEFVEPYYVSYEYYIKYGSFPYGQRSHGFEGIIESYKELFYTTELIEAFDVAVFIRDKKYRGHLPCPCGSGKRLRNCHGPVVMKFHNSETLMNQLTYDLNNLEEVLRAYSKSRNTKKAK